MTTDITVRARFATPVPLAGGMVAFWRGETDASDLIGGHTGTFYTGTIPGTVLDVRNMIRQRWSKGWVSLSNWIDQSA